MPTYCLAAENKQITIFSDYAIDDAVSLKIAELRIGFIGCNDVRDIFAFEFFDELKYHQLDIRHTEQKLA